MMLSWDNFGLESTADEREDVLIVPATKSLEDLVALSELSGKNGLLALFLQTANILDCVACHIGDDWHLLVDAPGEEVWELDPVHLHNRVKDEIEPDFVMSSDGAHSVLRVRVARKMSSEIVRTAHALEIPQFHSACEIGFNLRKLQLHLSQNGGQLILARGHEAFAIPSPDDL